MALPWSRRNCLRHNAPLEPQEQLKTAHTWSLWSCFKHGAPLEPQELLKTRLTEPQELQQRLRSPGASGTAENTALPRSVRNCSKRDASLETLEQLETRRSSGALGTAKNTTLPWSLRNCLKDDAKEDSKHKDVLWEPYGHSASARSLPMWIPFGMFLLYIGRR